MMRRLRNLLGLRADDEDVYARIESARASVLAVLDNVLDDEADLGRIFELHERERPAPLHGSGDRGPVEAVCDRIGMLDAALTTASKADRASPGLSIAYMTAARRFLLELRSGLLARTLSAHDAFRLLESVRHDLQEADRVLRTQHGMSLQEAVHARVKDLRELNSDLMSQLEVISEKVMLLFGYSDDSAPVLLPQH